MKKYIFFQAFIGDEQTTESEANTRLAYIYKQLEYLEEQKNLHQFTGEHFLIVTAPACVDAKIFEIVDRFSLRLWTHEFNRINSFEYPGFLAMQSWADTRSEESAILYCHSKGSVNTRKNSMGIFRLHTSTLLRTPIDEIFKDGDLSKAGLFPSKYGWFWHNFFWVRSSFLRKKRVSDHDNRHYFESFIGQHGDEKGYESCFSLLPMVFDQEREGTSFQVRRFYEPEDINANPYLIEKYNQTQSSWNKITSEVNSASIKIASRTNSLLEKLNITMMPRK